MKIAVFHNVPPGGAKRAVYEEVKYLSKKHKIDIYRYSSTDESFLDISPFAENVYTFNFELESKYLGFLRRIEKDYKNFFVLKQLSKNIAQKINSKKYDVALVHPDKFTQAPYLLNYLKIPTLYFCEEYLRMVYEEQFRFKETGNIFKDYYEFYTRNVRKYIDKDNARSADLIVANSRFTQKNIQKAYGVKAKYCHLGVDPKVFKPMRKRIKEKYALFIGDKSDNLGYGLAKNTLKLVDKNIKLYNLGFSSGSKRVNDDKKMATEYTNALFVLCTHQNEPFGIPPLESMACETPVLAVNEGGYKETVVDGVTGYLLPRNPKAFAEKIKFLLKNPNIAKKTGKAGRKHVIKNFTWQKHNKKIENFLLKLANGENKANYS